MLRCAIKVDVDSRGPMWVEGVIKAKMSDDLGGKYVINSEDHLYYVNKGEVFLNAEDLKDFVDSKLLSIL
jgi:hypothetical protein